MRSDMASRSHRSATRSRSGVSSTRSTIRLTSRPSSSTGSSGVSTRSNTAIASSRACGRRGSRHRPADVADPVTAECRQRVDVDRVVAELVHRAAGHEEPGRRLQHHADRPAVTRQVDRRQAAHDPEEPRVVLAHHHHATRVLQHLLLRDLPRRDRPDRDPVAADQVGEPVARRRAVDGGGVTRFAQVRRLVVHLRLHTREATGHCSSPRLSESDKSRGATGGRLAA